MTNVSMSAYARTQYHAKYAHTLPSGRKEIWEETAERVVTSVVKPFLPHLVAPITKLVTERKLMPGGRYLSAAGRRTPYVTNCYLFDVDDSREGWADLMHKVTHSLMTGGGVGVVYSKLRPEGGVIKGLGGSSTGPLALMNMVNESGRYVMQGGSRRSAIWAGLHWWHPDIYNFVHMKEWSDLIREMKSKDFLFTAPMEGTNISVILDTDFFDAIKNPLWTKTYSLWGTTFTRTYADTWRIYNESVALMRRRAEPGFSIDYGKDKESLRNAPVHGDTMILTDQGYQRAADLADLPSTIWTGKQWVQNVVFKTTATNALTVRVAMTGGREIVCEPSHPFMVENYQGWGKNRRLVSIERVPASELEEGDIIAVSLPQPKIEGVDNVAYTIGFLYGDGSFVGKNKAEVAICSETKEICLDRLLKGLDCHLSHNDARGFKRLYYRGDNRLLGHDKGRVPTSLSPTWTASFLAGLFDADGNAHQGQRRFRLSSVRKSFLEGVRRMLESVGILANVSKGGPSGYGGQFSWQLVVAGDYTVRFSEIIPTLRAKLDLTGYKPYRRSTVKVISVVDDKPDDVYCADVKAEEHSFQAEGVLVSNCTELSSEDDSDNCNLASLNLARFETLDEFAEASYLGTAFLLCGSKYGLLPLPEMQRIREKNRRIGLGLMGIHEWLLVRGYRYEPCRELGGWMGAYQESDRHAEELALILDISDPLGKRAIAPTGTISIVAETTSGAEPITSVAYKRRYLKGKDIYAQFVVDPTAHRLITERGVDPNQIEDAMSLAQDISRRVQMQAWLQQYVDHGISSTINLPAWDESRGDQQIKELSNALLPSLQNLRGITAYPDGSRGGQPFTPVPYEEAIAKVGVEFRDNSEDNCRGGFCNS